MNPRRRRWLREAQGELSEHELERLVLVDIMARAVVLAKDSGADLDAAIELLRTTIDPTATRPGP